MKAEVRDRGETGGCRAKDVMTTTTDTQELQAHTPLFVVIRIQRKVFNYISCRHLSTCTNANV